MKALRIGAVLVFIASLVALVWQWTLSNDLRRENEQLRADLNVARSESAQHVSPQSDASRQADEANVAEIARLRSEVTTLRAAAKELEATKARAAQLQAQNQQLRAQSPGAASTTTAPAPSPVTGDTFPREAWAFAGYASPESALVSAIWSMREGNPKTYFESLSPDEQARMTQLWGNKPETEVAAKHQSDVSKISSFRIVDRQEVSPEQVVMSVYIAGVERLEKVSMQKVGTDWKFAGFVRETKP